MIFFQQTKCKKKRTQKLWARRRVQVSSYLLEEITLETDEVVGLDDVGAALAAEHPREQGLHGGRALPCAHHGVCNLGEKGNVHIRTGYFQVPKKS